MCKCSPNYYCCSMGQGSSSPCCSLCSVTWGLKSHSFRSWRRQASPNGSMPLLSLLSPPCPSQLALSKDRTVFIFAQNSNSGLNYLHLVF